MSAADGEWAAARDAASVAAGSNDEICLLDPRGVIVHVNPAWVQFCRENGGDVGRCGVGTSYLAACEAARGDPGADAVATAIRSALRGGLLGPLRVIVPCHSPARQRWFDVLVSSRTDPAGDCLGATVVLTPAARPNPAPLPRLPTRIHATDAVRLRDLVRLVESVRLIDAAVNLMTETGSHAASATAGQPDVEGRCPVCARDVTFHTGWAYDEFLRVRPVVRGRCRSCGWEPSLRSRPPSGPTPSDDDVRRFRRARRTPL